MKVLTLEGPGNEMLLEVSRIDDKALTMTFELYMDFMWKEARKELLSSLEAGTDSEIFSG